MSERQVQKFFTDFGTKVEDLDIGAPAEFLELHHNQLAEHIVQQQNLPEPLEEPQPPQQPPQRARILPVRVNPSPRYLALAHLPTPPPFDPTVPLRTYNV